MKRILIVGATGRVGRQLLRQLPVKEVRVRAMVRNPEAACLPPEVEVVRGDLTAPETLDACLDDIDTVFLVWTAPPVAVAPGLDRMLKRARWIVFLSSPHKTPHPFFQQPNSIRLLHARTD
jgi:nucleoside-diphosphate-sugar epimerase